MKKNLLLLLTTLWLVSCADPARSPEPNLTIIEYQGCEYIVSKAFLDTHGSGGTMCHRGDCKYCRERLRKALEAVDYE